MPRKIAEPYVQWKVSLPGTLAARVELLLFDPTYQKPAYGDRSKLICELLQVWVDNHNRQRNPIPSSRKSHATPID